jgi:hypothetical protein
MLHRTVMGIAAVAALVCCAQSVSAQSYSTRYARAVAMGNTYTGVAEGLEASMYNNAGLAGLTDAAAAFSYGQGEGWPFACRAFDAAAALPLDSGVGTVAASYHAANRDFTYAGRYLNDSRLQLHYGRIVAGGLALGASVNVNRVATDLERRNEANEILASGARSHIAFDCSLSGLYARPRLLLPAWDDLLRCGIHLDNALGTKMEEFGRGCQVLSIGASYQFTPPIEPIAERTALRVLLAAALHYDNSLSNASWSWNVARPDIGIELRILDLLSLRCGRENRLALGSWKVTDPQYPATRVGAGVDLPVGALLGFARDLRLRFDYAHSYRDNQQFLDDFASYLYDVSHVPRDAFTLQVLYRP